jgi:hypothetical protein
MAVPQHRNEKKYRHRRYLPMTGRHTLKLVDKQPIELEKPFNLDDLPPDFEDWLDKPTLEEVLLADQGNRFLIDGSAGGGDDYGDDYDDIEENFEDITE